MQALFAAGLAAALTVAVQPASAEDFPAGSLVVQQPWTRATPGGAQVAGGYFTVVNHGGVPDQLVGGSLEAATKAGLHEMSSENGVMRMRPTGPLPIPAGGSLTLTPSGKHIMFTGLKRPLKQGDQVAGTLVFEHAGTIAVRFRVESVGAGKQSSMPGMDMD